MAEVDGVNLGTENMKTDLDVVSTKVKGGRKPKADPYYMSNELLHAALEPFSRAMFALLENDMNNSFAGNSKRQTRRFFGDFENFKSALKLAVDNHDGPTTTLEKEYLIALPTGEEIQACPNMRNKQVAKRWLRVAEMTIDLDTSSMQSAIHQKGDLDDELKIAYNYMVHYWGDPNKADDFGANIDPHKYLGRTDPSLDFEYVKLGETSPDRVRSGLARGDAPDHAKGEAPK